MFAAIAASGVVFLLARPPPRVKQKAKGPKERVNLSRGNPLSLALP